MLVPSGRLASEGAARPFRKGLTAAPAEASRRQALETIYWRGDERQMPSLNVLSAFGRVAIQGARPSPALTSLDLRPRALRTTPNASRSYSSK